MLKLGPVDAETPLRFGHKKQLLVDNEVLCDCWQMRRVQETVRKHPQNPVIEADQPWEKDAKEGNGLQPGAVMYDEEAGLFKFWYRVVPYVLGSAVGYATSTDGVSWTKPDLGLVEYSGTIHNNVCRQEPAGKPVTHLSLVQDAREDAPERRYKGVWLAPYHEDGTRYSGWTGSGFSADGITWHQTDGGSRMGGGGGRATCMWDERLGRYVMFQRQHSEGDWQSIGGLRLPKVRGSFLTREESRDLIHWSPRQTVYIPMNLAWPSIEGMRVFLHEGIYFALANMQYDFQVTGKVELNLLTSRDGYRWEHHFPRQPLIPHGPAGDFDYLVTWEAVVTVHDDTMWLYYGGEPAPQSKPYAPIVDDGSPRLAGVPRPAAIGLATVPLDRLIGLRADEPVGTFMTRPFVVEGDELYVNANVDRELRVEVVNPVTELIDMGKKGSAGHYVGSDPGKQRYEGFTREDCALVAGDSLRHRVRWKGGSLGRFRGQGIRLRFLARMATVYAFQVAD